jgi:hypothetical protein
MLGHQVNFVCFQDTGTARPTKKGGLLARHEDGVVIKEVERGLDLDILDLLQAVAKGDDCSCWQGQGRCSAKQWPINSAGENKDLMVDQLLEGMTMDLNTMHKTKDKKV